VLPAKNPLEGFEKPVRRLVDGVLHKTSSTGLAANIAAGRGSFAKIPFYIEHLRTYAKIPLIKRFLDKKTIFA
jgi:hypothetical protein